MTDVTIKFLAAEIQTSVDRLVQQFAGAGIYKTILDSVTQQEKEILLAYLKRTRAVVPNKLTLQRKTRSTLNITSTSGKSKSVQIEVRKKRTYVQRDINKVQEQVTEEQSKSKLENFTQQQFQVKVHNQTKYEVTEKIKITAEKKSKHTTNKQEKYVIAKSSKLINQQTNTINKSLQAAEKVRRETEAAELKRKTEAEIRRKIEENARQIAEEARRMADERGDSWDHAPEHFNEDNTDYHITTYYHAREAEDENDRKVENDRRNRIRSSKSIKHKKTSRLFESKANREEARAIIRSNKSKRKLSTLTQSFNKPIQQVVNRNVVIGETVTVAELANKMAVKGSQVIKILMNLGVIATINQVIDQETAHLVVEEIGHKVILLNKNELEESIMLDRNTYSTATLESRAPIVTIMGHVDHGKTSLLDSIRSTHVAKDEVGGITQHIGAYRVETDSGIVTFLDTPGHAAFTAMRLRGTQVTDIVVLVVACDDGVMPQTIEAIQHAKAASVPVVVAINKIDKPEADPERIKHELTQYGIVPEEWGGENQFVQVSAKLKLGINQLINAILLQAEILELKAIRIGMAKGVVIESFLDKGRGPIATVLVREGTLNRGDIVLCGLEYGRVRAMRDEKGNNIVSAGPSIPVEILGLSGVPSNGDEATVIKDERKAREVALYRQNKFREVKLAYKQNSNIEKIFNKKTDVSVSELNIVLKSDVKGSSEAISDALKNLSTNEVKVKVIGSGVGNITESDAMLAASSNAILLGFNVRADASARIIINAENIDLRFYSVIYNLLDEVQQVMSSMLAPKYTQKVIGIAEVRHVFYSPKFGTVAGCMVIDGIIKNHNKIRILRKSVVIYEGELESLRRFKDDVSEVRNGMECGISIKNYKDVCSGDVIELLETTKV